MAPATVPCQYKTGKTLGSGTYAVVKEAVHVATGKYYAVKVISKKLMAGREHMVRNEINVLKKVSIGHPNVLTLHDYFETLNNLYLVTDLCTGGELFDRICSKGSYYESDACHLVRVITSAVAYLHDQGIVHRDLKPEVRARKYIVLTPQNLLFRGPEEDSDLLIADFGLSRVIDDQKLTVLTTTCGTPGYMAPESVAHDCRGRAHSGRIFKKEGHGKPVDVWAIGVITYFLLCGYTPFDRDNNVAEIQAICAADFKFEPKEYWEHVSDPARDFIRQALTIDQKKRMSAKQALDHPWLQADLKTHAAGEAKDLLPNMRANFDARRTLRKAIWSVRWANAVQKDSHANAEEKAIRSEAEDYKRDANEEDIAHGQNVLATS